MKLKRIAPPVEHHSYDSCDQLIQKAQNYTTLFADQFAGKKSTTPSAAVLHGTWAFFRFYLLKRNLFYGYAGFITSFCFSVMSFLKYTKLYERNQRLHQTAQKESGDKTVLPLPLSEDHGKRAA
jgi:hypothetical protein